MTPQASSPNPAAVNRVYLDYNATTPLDPEARQAMEPTLAEDFGNPSSIHWAGQAARKAQDDARAKVARIFNVTPGEIVFTSGGTEAANLAIYGVLMAPGGATGGPPSSAWTERSEGSRRMGARSDSLPASRQAGTRSEKVHVITSSVEHHCVLEPLRSLEEGGTIEVTRLPVDRMGRIDPDDVRRAIRPETRLIAIMFVNNETGNIHPVTAIGRIAREARIPFFCDGVQAVGKLPVDLKLLPVDLFSFSAHKFYGPKGAGGLYIRKGLNLKPLVLGGGQEGGRRGGTENLPGLIGLASALERSYRDLASEARREAFLRDRLQERILDIPGSRLHGDPDHRLPNTLNVGFEGIDSETILIALDREGIAVSNGAACASGTLEPSHVLRAMGYEVSAARGAVRFSLGRQTTERDIDTTIGRVRETVARLRER